MATMKQEDAADNATEFEADAAIAILERAINAARNSNQAGENAVVRAAAAITKAFDEAFDEARVEEAFVDGAQACREMLARFVEQGGDAATAASIRANWHPGWGNDPGPLTGDIPINAWGITQKMLDRSRERCRAALARSRGVS